MKPKTIGAVARETGLPVRTIRYYEAEGVLPAPRRDASGYRRYEEVDLRRLHLVDKARSLGLGLPTMRLLVEKSGSDCSSFVLELARLIAVRRREVALQIRDLTGLAERLASLDREANEAVCINDPSRLVLECDCCPLIDEPDKEAAVTLSREDRLEVLACDIAARPAGAPTFEDVAPSVVAVARDGASITVEFALEAADAVAALVAAEQKCCSDLTWELRRDSSVRLRVGGTPPQLDVLLQMLKQR